MSDTPLELWHSIYDAALAVGCDPSEAVIRADEQYWPHDGICPDGYRYVLAECSPFRCPPSTPDRITVGKTWQ